MSDWDQQVYWERHAAGRGGGSVDEETESTRPVSPRAGHHQPDELENSQEALYEYGRRNLRARLITAGIIAVLVIGAVTALVAIASSGSGGGAPSGGFADTPGGVLYPGGGDDSPTPGAGPTTETPSATPSPALTPSVRPSSRALPGPTTVRTNPAPTGTIVTRPTAGLVIRIVSRATGNTVAVSLGSTASGAPIVESANLGTAAQWRLLGAGGSCFLLLNVHSGLALDNTDGTFEDGAQMQQWLAVTGNTNQTWCFQALPNSSFSIRNKTSGSLLDLRDGLSEDGTPIQQWSADPQAPNLNQTWQLRAVG